MYKDHLATSDILFDLGTEDRIYWVTLCDTVTQIISMGDPSAIKVLYQMDSDLQGFVVVVFGESGNRRLGAIYNSLPEFKAFLEGVVSYPVFAGGSYFGDDFL